MSSKKPMFVQHQGFEGIQPQAAALQVIHDAAGCAHHHMGTVFQAGQLRAHGGATAQGEHLDVFFGARQAAHLLRHLLGQFSRGAQHQGLHGKLLGVEFGEQRQGKRGCFATAGFGLGDEILPGQRQGQGCGLNRRHLPVTQLRQIGQHGCRQRQVVEGQRRTGSGGLLGRTVVFSHATLSLPPFSAPCRVLGQYPTSAPG
jgi:hypothetical protein